MVSINKLAWALYWASRRFRIFPCLPGGKQPAIDRFQVQATCDAETIRAWWGRGDDWNIGAVPDGQIVTDMDIKSGRSGIDDFHNLGLSLTDTLVVQTPTGGLHAWYRAPPTANSAGRVAPGIDTRGPNGYALMPGSVIDGLCYSIINDAEPAVCPTVILDKLRAPRNRAEEQSPLVNPDNPSAIALATAFLDGAEPAIEGQGGNSHSFVIASELRDLGLSEDRAAELMLGAWNARCVPPWAPEELSQIVANAYEYAQNPPGSKHPYADFGAVKIPEPVQDIVSAAGRELPSDNPFMAFGNTIPVDFLPARPWVLHRFLLRGDVTTLIAPGGVGKSQFSLTIAVLLALGREDVFGFYNYLSPRPAHSILYNAEDSIEEMSMRLYALCKTMNVDPATVIPYIVMVSGKKLKFKMLTVNDRGQVVMSAEAIKIMNWIVEAARNYNVAMVSIDPMNKTHEVNEVDNIVMARYMENMAALAAACSAGLLLSHHMSKPPYANSSPYAGNANSARGGTEIVNGSRAAFTLAAPSPEDILQYGMSPDVARRHLRLDDAKANKTLTGEDAVWIRKEAATLDNGEAVGAFVPGDIRAAAAEVRGLLARTLGAELRGRGSGSATLAEAAVMLMAADPIYAALGAKQVQARIERALATSVEGVNLIQDGNKRLITLG